MTLRERLNKIEWVNSCNRPSDEITDDERCAHIVCCPCYTTVALGDMFLVPFMILGVMIGSAVMETCGVVTRVCTGKARNTRTDELNEAP